MLINFSVENFRSFGEEQTLNLMASPKLSDHPGHCVRIANTTKDVLRLSVLYGANAAGKSNLIKAIGFAQMLILGRMPFQLVALNQFRFQGERKPISFEFRFQADGQVFAYGISLTPDAVTTEWLDATSTTGRETAVFKREGNAIKIGRMKLFGEQGGASEKALKALKLLGVRADQLLLSKIIDLSTEHRGELLNRVSWWFTDCLNVVGAETHYAPLLDLLNAEADFKKLSTAFLTNVGTGIDGLSIEQIKIDAEKLPRELLKELHEVGGDKVAVQINGPGVSIELDGTDPTKIVRKNLMAKHRVGKTEYSLSFQDESDGTQRCLNLLPALYHLTKSSKVFVIDEIDRSLHPLLCHALLKLFVDARPGAFQQMIVTTHETHLLDLELLRRDEIWFVEKDQQQQSKLTSLSEWKIRNDVRLEKGYLLGRFGGIPFIGDPQRLIDMMNVEANGATHAEKTPT